MNRHAAALCAVILLAFPALALAQSSDGDPPAQPPRDLNAMSLEDLMHVKVVGAALHPQTLEDAPASVTIITAEDIATYGYRTLGEALASIRGFYSSNNYTYQTIGVRGINLPGDYASRILVMVNGHNMADNVFDYMLLFNDGFPIDMNLVKQIEIIRGPSSALYGTDGIFATINIITKSPAELPRASVTTETGSFGEKKAQVAVSGSVGDASFLLSGSIFNNSGMNQILVPQFDSPSTNNGEAVNMNGEQGYHFFGTLMWHDWTFTAAFAGRSVVQPVSWGETIFNDRGTKAADTRDYVEAAYSRDLHGGTLQWRTYYDAYAFDGREDYALNPLDLSAGVEDNRTIVDGKWVGSEVSYRFDVAFIGTVTAGMEGKIDLKAVQIDEDVQPVPVQYLYTNNPDRQIGVFLQDERRLSSRWALDLGIRYDYSAYRANFVSPRAALIYQPGSEWTYKFLYGRAFRNPSAFELYYGDGVSGVANPSARHEKADTVEFDLERKIGKRLKFTSAVYGYQLNNWLVPERSTGGLIEYENVGKLHAEGIELEMDGRPSSWLQITASYSFQKATDDVEHTRLENSPDHLAKLRFALPLGRKLQLSSSLQYYSGRYSLAAVSLPPTYLADLTLTSRHLTRNVDFQFGIRNAFNRSYADPVALNPLVDTLLQPQRSFYLRFTGSTREPGR